MIVLDTNVCIAIMRDPIQSDTLIAMLQRFDVSNAVISTVSLYELEMGVVGRAGEVQARGSLTMLLAGPISVALLTDEAACAAAQLNAAARKRGLQLASLDSLIAGHALSLGASLVTSDTKLMAALSGVEVISWR